MPKRAHRKQSKPGFLLIETMMALLIVVITASIMAHYAAFSGQKQASFQADIKSLFRAQELLDEAREGKLAKIDHSKYSLVSEPQELAWSDGVHDTIWKVSVRLKPDKGGDFLTTFDSRRPL